MSKKEKLNGNKPATQADLSTLAGEMTRRLGSIEDKMATKDALNAVANDLTSLKSDVKSLKSGQAAILNVVQSVDQQLQEWKPIPAKVDRLHKRVFPSR